MHSAQPLRVSLRRTAPDGSRSDLVGDLVRADDESIVVLPLGRGPVTIPRQEVTAMRKVPPRVVRPTSSVDDLVRLADESWPGTRVVRMGGWTLHVGLGYSRRANSCHPTGDPERPLPLAIDQVVGFYREQGLAPRFQLATRPGDRAGQTTELDRLLADRRWERGATSLVMVADLTVLDVEPAPSHSTNSIRWTSVPDERWLSVQGEEHPGRLPVLTSAEAHYATVGETEPSACGRLAVVRDWGCLSGLFVRPDRRRCGHGQALTIAMMVRARDLGASYCHLQVEAGNSAAIALYESLGFAEHHRYHYRMLR
ncbi:GNAT family N-acetyltransferase [Luteococcus sp. Sow4_B9]|uniref:GNAT family N-acetyltransferase n=1 Tax=Luteococcus sp. Sow4_B9 TaxID=3438792 RepID=UPI003F959F64